MAEPTPQPKKLPLVPIVVGAVVLVAAGFIAKNIFSTKYYEKRAEQMFEQQTGGKANIDLESGESSFEFETEEGKVVINQEGQLPADFPNDIEIYRGAEVTGYVSMESEEIKGFNATISTEDSAEDVYNFYLSSLESNGWDILTKLSSGTYSSVSAEKDTRTIVVTITADTEETIAVITVQTE